MSNISNINSLSNQVGAFHKWKQDLSGDIAEYKNWLEEMSLDSLDVRHRLDRAGKQLQEDELTIAFVGEYSRGKTELINALIFSEYGRRMLPSQAGRTTMCPTELFYDRKRKCSYLRLLPIESRRLNAAISDLKKKPDLWHEFPLDLSKPEELNQTLQQVAACSSMRKDEAEALGFDESMLELDPKNSQKVLVPKWRHAELSLKSALLEQGLRVLDTPGLNALGSEPELTISMIPNAQAVIFMLSADTGVTASDLAIWNDFIKLDKADHRAGRFAVLNKVDVLWDDIQGETHTAASIERVRQDTANRLGIDVEDVVPLSAKQALIAQLNDDAALHNRSALPKLENLILSKILGQKEKLLHEALIDDVSSLVGNSQKVIRHRIERLSNDLERSLARNVDGDSLKQLAEQTQADHAQYFQKLVALKSSRRLMNSQGDILQELAGMDKFDALSVQTKEKMQHAWSTLGMSAAMRSFFVELDKIFDGLCLEARVADKMVEMIYQRFRADMDAPHLHPKPFSVKKQRLKLNELKIQLGKYRRNPKMLVIEQTILIKRFSATFIRAAREQYQEILLETERWSEEALLPLMQYTLEQKQSLESQMTDLRHLAKESRTIREEREAIEDMIAKLNAQLDKTQTLQAHFKHFPHEAIRA
jgi:hypothetical protein